MIANVLLDNTKKFNKKFSQYLQQKETMDYVMKKLKVTNQKKLEKSNVLLIKKYGGKTY